MTNCLEVKNISKSFGEFTLRDISFTLPKGYIMGLIGPNGSGKTTTIKLILNMLRRDSGSINIFGLDNISHEQEVKKKTGAVFEPCFFDGEWSVARTEKNLSVFYENWDSALFSELLGKFRISAKKLVKELSKGMQMKLMLACALSYNAKLLILDEPTSGLDPVSRDELLEYLNAYISDGEHSVLFSTHITSDLQRSADYITYITDGEMFFSGGKDEFTEMFRIAKGGTDELTPLLTEKALGIRKYSLGFEALVKTESLYELPGLHTEPASIDDIIIFTAKRSENI
ncbi:MAG: ABC transporter ATP-binding protein [Oscillospiraceae bacterium]|nr:ABC transporter ATP-binding protein [Oscillospiraceae bacterium]